MRAAVFVRLLHASSSRSHAAVGESDSHQEHQQNFFHPSAVDLHQGQYHQKHR